MTSFTGRGELMELTTLCNPIYKARAAIEEEKLCLRSPMQDPGQQVLSTKTFSWDHAESAIQLQRFLLCGPPCCSPVHTVSLSFIHSPAFKQTISDCFAHSLFYLWALWRTFFACLYPKCMVSVKPVSARDYNLNGVAPLPHCIGHHYISNLHFEILWKVKANWKLTQTLSQTPQPPAKFCSLTKNEFKFLHSWDHITFQQKFAFLR